MTKSDDLNAWVVLQNVIANQILNESIEQLRLTPQEEDGLRRRMVNIVRQYFPSIVRGMALIASLETCSKKDRQYFKCRGVPDYNTADLAQETATNILKALFNAWPRHNIGAWRSKIRSNVLSDYGRTRQLERQHVETDRDPDFLPDKCNPAIERAYLDDISCRWSALEMKIIRARIDGDEWSQIGERFGMSAESAKRIARCLLLPEGKSISSPRRLRT